MSSLVKAGQFYAVFLMWLIDPHSLKASSSFIVIAGLCYFLSQFSN